MPAEALPSSNEGHFVLAALSQNIRIDGRSLDQFRPIHLAFGDNHGQADVRIGKTRVLVNVSAHVVVPYVDRKFDGVFTISTELSPIASPAFEVGRYVHDHDYVWNDCQENGLTDRLDKTRRESS